MGIHVPVLSFFLPAMSVRFLVATVALCLVPIVQAADRPNILWLVSEDNGPQLGCYGDRYAVTPNLDAFALRSLRYEMCWSNAPVCAPARTTLISGMYATSLGGHHMRSGVRLPEDLELFPHVMREAGYYCTNRSKTDYNFLSQEAGWHQSGRRAHYRDRPNATQPFFAVFNFETSHESRIRQRPHTLKHDPAKAPLPRYHPDTPEVRHDWAQYYDKMTAMDREVGKVLEQLEADGLADSTIVFYYGDHGSGMPRSKRWPFNSGLQVPLMIHVPEVFKEIAPRDYREGGATNRKVSFVDFGPTVLSLAGQQPPASMQGVPFMGQHAGTPKEYLFGFRGRMDERIDRVRSVTDGRFVYMRHFFPDRPYLKHIGYMFETPTTSVWKRLFDAGKLNEAQGKFWRNKPYEELFDLHNDPDEVRNLATDPAYTEKRNELRGVLKSWMVETKDMGLFPEAEMHRVCSQSSPRQYATSGQVDFLSLVDAAWDATGGTTTERLAAMATHEQPVFRYWAARGMSLSESTDRLVPLLKDSSPSVSIAACDRLLTSQDVAIGKAAEERLFELANVQQHGHFVAIAALNVMDFRMSRDRERSRRLAELPRKHQPPPRIGKYVGRLLEHAINP